MRELLFKSTSRLTSSLSLPKTKPKMSEPAQPPKAESKPKPCCVCKPEKEARDQCLLMNGQESGKCDDLISQYKVCMKGFGFETN